MRKWICFIACMVICASSQAQKGILWDKVNDMPVAHASIYTSANGKTSAALSDKDGRFDITFPFKELTVSHISYAKRKIASISDTISLEPTEVLIQEVTVSNIEPEWIKVRQRACGLFLQQRGFLNIGTFFRNRKRPDLPQPVRPLL